MFFCRMGRFWLNRRTAEPPNRHQSLESQTLGVLDTCYDV